jgi:hypothetical protein
MLQDLLPTHEEPSLAFYGCGQLEHHSSSVINGFANEGAVHPFSTDHIFSTTSAESRGTNPGVFAALGPLQARLNPGEGSHFQAGPPVCWPNSPTPRNDSVQDPPSSLWLDGWMFPEQRAHTSLLSDLTFRWKQRSLHFGFPLH